MLENLFDIRDSKVLRNVNAVVLFRVRIFWIFIFNIFLFMTIFFGITKLFIKSELFGYLTISAIFAILVLFIFSEIAMRKYNLKKDEKKIIEPQNVHRLLLEQMLNKIPYPPFTVSAFLVELDDYYKYGLTKKKIRSRVSADYDGSYIKIMDGIRSGINPSSKFEKKVFMLGGSTVSCLEGPDEWTLPSRVQHQLNYYEIPKKVINFGVSGATTFDRFIAASDQELAGPGDTLFFWFGVNEGKGLWGRRGIGILKFWPGFVELFALVRQYSKSTIINWLYLELVRFDEKAHRRLARTRAARLRRNFDIEFQKWAIKDVRVIAGLQPTIFSALSSDSDRESLAKNWKPEMKTVMNIQYEEFRSSFVGADYFIDFSDSTNNDPKNSFVDWVHLSWSGNETVACEIYRSGILSDDQLFE